MIDKLTSRSLRRTTSGVLPLVAAVAILLIMVGSIIIVLLGGSVNVQFSFP